MSRASEKNADGSPIAPAGPSTRLRAPVKWGLVGTLLVTVASLRWPQREPVSAQAGGNRSAYAPASSVVRVQPPVVAPLRGPEAFSSRPEDPAVSASGAMFDPFIGVLPPAPPPPPVVQPIAAASPPPAPPPQDYRFLGRVTAPDGSEQILLSRNDVPVFIKVGTTLDNGYSVESISENAVVLVYPPLGSKAPIHIPPNRSAF